MKIGGTLGSAWEKGKKNLGIGGNSGNIGFDVGFSMPKLPDNMPTLDSATGGWAKKQFGGGPGNMFQRSWKDRFGGGPGNAFQRSWADRFGKPSFHDLWQRSRGNNPGGGGPKDRSTPPPLSPEDQAAADEAADLEKYGPKYKGKATKWKEEDYGQLLKGYNVSDYQGDSAFSGANPYQMAAQNFDPHRQSAMNQAEAVGSSSLASAEDQLRRSGGLSASDQMNLMNQSNRSKIAGRQGLQDNINKLESQNIYDTGMYNTDARNKFMDKGLSEADRRTQEEWGARDKSANDLWTENAKRDYDSTEARNTHARRMAENKTKNRKEQYDADYDRWLFGKQAEGNEASADAMEKEAGRRGSWWTNPGVDTIEGIKSLGDFGKHGAWR